MFKTPSGPPANRPPPPQRGAASNSSACERPSSENDDDKMASDAFSYYKRTLSVNSTDWSRPETPDLPSGKEVEFWHSAEERARIHNLRSMDNHPIYQIPEYVVENKIPAGLG